MDDLKRETPEAGQASGGAFDKVQGDYNTVVQNLCSGYGSYHSPNAEKNPRPLIACTLADVETMLANPSSQAKSSAQWVIPSTLLSRTHAEQHKDGEFWALWADIDEPDGVAFADLVKITDNVITGDFIAYTSRSATEERQKARLIVPLSEPVSGGVWLTLQKILNDKLEAAGITPDRVTERTGQLCYLPNRGEFYDYHHEQFTGPVSPDSWADEMAEEAQRQAKEEQEKKARAKPAKDYSKAVETPPGGIRPSDYFLKNYRARDLMDSAGADFVSEKKFYSPGRDSDGCPGGIYDPDTDRFITYHEKDPFCDGQWHGAIDLLMHMEGIDFRSPDAFLELCKTIEVEGGVTIELHNQRAHMAAKDKQNAATDAKESRKAAAEAKKEAATSDNLPPFPEDLSDLPHGLGELQSYVFGTMIYPSSAAAGFTALALYTSLAQTHLTIDSMGGLGFNEQYMMLGGTGSGKEGTRKPFGRIHKELKQKVFNAGSMPQILRSAPSSKQGLHKHLEENNSLVMLSDEFGEWLCTTDSGSHKQEALGYLMEIYSSALESVHPGGAVVNKYMPVENPRVMLYTTSTAERMLETMSASQADSGSYNRFVILTMGKEAYPKRYEGFKWEPSRQTMDPLEWLIKQTGVVDVSPEAWERFKAQDKAITDPIKHADPQMGGRLAEQAIKLAGLVALSDKRMKINADDMNVAFSLRVGLYKRTKALFDGEGAISNQHITTKAADQIRAALERKPVLYRSQLPSYSRQYKQLSVAEQNAVVVSLIEDGSMRQSEGSKSRFTSHLFDV
jgi:hypothetical protein